MSKPRWTVADTIDLEVFLADDEDRDGLDGPTLHERDRAIYLKSFEGHEEAPNRRDLLKAWLEARRKRQFRSEESIGAKTTNVFILGAIFLGLIGILAASSAITAFFFGGEVDGGYVIPANILLFYGVCIALPLVLTAYSIYSFVAIAVFRRLPQLPPFARRLWTSIFAIWVAKIMDKVASRTKVETRLSVSSAIGRLRMVAAGRKSILSAAVFFWVQAFGIGYAVGLPVAFAIKYYTLNRAVGWQTNARESITPESIYHYASLSATPWAWVAGESDGYPSIEQVRSTEYIQNRPLKASETDADAWSAWSRFLLFSAVFYVTLPRFLLGGLSWVQLRRALKLEPFADLRHEALANRMTTPLLSSDPPANATNESAAFSDTEPTQVTESPLATSESNKCIVVISADLFSESLAAAVTEQCQSSKLEPGDVLEMSEDYDDQQSFFEQLSDTLKQHQANRLLLVEDVMAAPTLEKLNLIKSARTAIGASTGIIVTLVDEDSSETSKQIFEVWQQKLRSLGDPNLVTRSLEHSLTP
ncbi:MAG: DUF2868 domain-containing protein [Verrucomicrobiota bacterium]